MFRKLLVVVAMAVTVSANSNNNTPHKSHTSTKGDLTNKRGTLLFNAEYINTQALRSLAAYELNYFKQDNVAVTTDPGQGATANIYSFEVSDKRGNDKNWSNLFAIQSVTFPPSTTNTAYGADTSLFTETYSLTSLDTNGALLGSLIWSGTYTAGAIPGTTTTAPGTTFVFPVTGATGVYKMAKAVSISFNANGVRDVRIMKSL